MSLESFKHQSVKFIHLATFSNPIKFNLNILTV